MRLMNHRRSLVTVCMACLLLTACETIDRAIPDKRVDYKTSRTAPKLEVPPDLTSSTIDDTLVVPEISPAPTATYSDYAAERVPGTAQGAGVLPQQPNLRIERDSQRQWLVLQGTPDQVWPAVREFWVKNGFVLTIEDPRIGIMETDWAENRADIPQDPVRRLISKALDSLYSAATRDKYRVRMEQGAEPGTTEVFLTHRGMEEVVQGTPDNETGTVWKPRATDPELEKEMLKRLVIHLGVEEQRAGTLLAQQDEVRPQARLVHDTNGDTALMFDEDFARAWRHTGVALDRVGFAVEDRDRTRGVYYVRYNDPLKGEKDKGFLSKLAFWGDDEEKQAEKYQVQLTRAEENLTRVGVLNAEGQPDNSATAKRILTLLQEQLK